MPSVLESNARCLLIHPTMSAMQANDRDARRVLRACIGKIATGPEYSTDLSLEEAYDAMGYILAGRVDPVQSAVFFIAMRMKRETDAENLGSLRAIMDVSRTTVAEVDEVVDIADPYDGYARCLPVSPFLPAVLAACGVCTVSHGLETVAPKYGATHRKVLRAAAAEVDLDVEQAAARVANRDMGWAYVDQKSFCPALHALIRLRDLMVKRPVISTVENLTGPIRGRRATHLITGYVHKAYPPIYARLAREAGFASGLLVRGVEGGVLPPLRQPGKVYEYRNAGALILRAIDPADLHIEHTVRAVPLPDNRTAESSDSDSKGTMNVDAIAVAAASAGLEALGGAPGPARDSLVYAGAVVLTHLRRYDSMASAADIICRALDTGAARERFYAGVKPV